MLDRAQVLAQPCADDTAGGGLALAFSLAALLNAWLLRRELAHHWLVHFGHGAVSVAAHKSFVRGAAVLAHSVPREYEGRVPDNQLDHRRLQSHLASEPCLEPQQQSPRHVRDNLDCLFRANVGLRIVLWRIAKH